MDAQLTVAIIACLGALTTLAGAVTLYIKQKTENEKRKAQIAEIVADREKVSRERDERERLLRDSLQKAEWEIVRLKEQQTLLDAKVTEQTKVSGILNVEIVKLGTKLDQVLETLKEMKEEKKEDKK